MTEGKNNLVAKILVVEDSEINRVFLASTLKEAGYAVEVASGGGKAIELATENSYDLIILDIHMPGVDGLAVLEEIKKGGASFNAKVIIVSSDKSRETFNLAKRLGASDYMVKPVGGVQLLERVSHWLGREHTKDSAEGRAVKIPEPGKPSGKKTILIVEDSPIQQAILESFLEGHDYEISLACDGEEAVSYALNTPFDIILLDVHMPGISGLEVLEKIKKSGASTNSKVILISSDANEETSKVAMDLGASDYILKPVSSHQLLEKVKQLIE